jgi:hypothetical protein
MVKEKSLEQYYNEIMEMRAVIGYDKHITLEDLVILNQKFPNVYPKELYRITETMFFAKEERTLLRI